MAGVLDVVDSGSKGKNIAVEEDYVSLDMLEEGAVVAVRVMVCRRWDASNAFGKYLSTEYILSDSEGNSIQCSARNNISHRFVSKLHEGSVYSLKNFSVVPNRLKFRVRKNDMHTISLEGYTVVRKLNCDPSAFARFPFDLTSLEDIHPNDSAYLIDVIGCVSDMSKLRTTKGGAELVEFDIVNERDILKRKGGAIEPYIVILPGMNIKEFRGEPYLSNTSATMLFDAPDIPQIAELSDIFRKCNMAVCPLKLSQPSVVVRTVYEVLQAGRDQKELRKKSCTFHCTARILNVRTKDGWFYFACGIGGCKKRVSRAGSKFMCHTCNKACEFPRASYRLHLTVADHSGSVVVTLFDEVATRLIGKKAAQLLEDSSEDGDEDVLPAPIVALTDGTHTFEIKSHSYYEQGAYESFTVSNLVDAGNVKVLPQKRGREDSDPDESLSEPNSSLDTKKEVAGTPPALGDDIDGFVPPAVLNKLVGKTYVVELKSHTYFDYNTHESFTCSRIIPPSDSVQLGLVRVAPKLELQVPENGSPTQTHASSSTASSSTPVDVDAGVSWVTMTSEGLAEEGPIPNHSPA